MAKRKERAANHVRRDGALALTFVNTGSRRSPRLRSYADLLAWSRVHGALTGAEAHRLETLAAESPDADAGAFNLAERLHGLLSAIMNARADRKAPPSAALAGLNALLVAFAPHRCLVRGTSSLQWAWGVDRPDDPNRPLWAVAQSATAVLTSPDYGKVRRCANEGCDVLFLAKGPGSPRKWCNDRTCGAPRRSRKHYRSVVKPRIRAFNEQYRNRYRRRPDSSEN